MGIGDVAGLVASSCSGAAVGSAIKILSARQLFKGRA